MCGGGGGDAEAKRLGISAVDNAPYVVSQKIFFKNFYHPFKILSEKHNPLQPEFSTDMVFLKPNRPFYKKRGHGYFSVNVLKTF